MLPGGGRRGAAARGPLQVGKLVTFPKVGDLGRLQRQGPALVRARVLSWTTVSF